MTQAVHVEGIRELTRAFALLGKGMEKGVPEALAAAADPVRFAAEGLAVSQIPRMTFPWSRMRVGVTRHTAYVAPVERGRRSRNNPRIRRPNLKPLLLDRALDPALAANVSRVERELRDALSDLFKSWARV